MRMFNIRAIVASVAGGLLSGAVLADPPPPEYIEKVDGQEALIARLEYEKSVLEYQRASAEVVAKESAWRKAVAKIAVKYQLDPELLANNKEGWDEQPDGRWKIRRVLKLQKKEQR